MFKFPCNITFHTKLTFKSQFNNINNITFSSCSFTIWRCRLVSKVRSSVSCRRRSFSPLISFAWSFHFSPSRANALRSRFSSCMIAIFVRASCLIKISASKEINYKNSKWNQTCIKLISLNNEWTTKYNIICDISPSLSVRQFLLVAHLLDSRDLQDVKLHENNSTFKCKISVYVHLRNEFDNFLVYMGLTVYAL